MATVTLRPLIPSRDSNPKPHLEHPIAPCKPPPTQLLKLPPIAILLRPNAKSFEPIVALKAKHPTSRPEFDTNPNPDPKRAATPFLFIVSRLYNLKTPDLQAQISSLASVRKPYDLKIGAPRVQVEPGWFKNSKGESEPLYGCGFELDATEFDLLKNEIFEDLNQHAEELRIGEFKPFYPQSARRSPLVLSIRSGKMSHAKEMASEIVEELRKDYPNGFGSVTADGIALRGRPFNHGDHENDGGEFLFSSA